NGSRLMLRSGTGTRYKIIGKYKNGTEVVLLEKTTSSWYKMLTPDGKQGYRGLQQRNQDTQKSRLRVQKLPFLQDEDSALAGPLPQHLTKSPFSVILDGLEGNFQRTKEMSV
ncbi:MAG TPA: SH3 domain-containing protein, partial [Candidatus Faecivicinus avistercoris]|nr:SH3 domain-containing protein [Candidatus Faecivicinus avistercoris]